jgi:glycolate oxidase FAD binding subunit
MTTTTNIAEALTAITGPEHVRPGDTIAVSPANTQQISEILRYADQNALTITPTGGKTKQSWSKGIQPNSTKTDIHLDLTRLNQVLEHPWQDLTCTVQAGCTWSTLQQSLAKHGQFVALDPLWPDKATVGGILATNDSGALRHRYGSLRDLIIGMTIVLADGTIARSGGKVVKNVAGYDLCKLLTGSLGTLAIITEATFRLHPLPQHPQTFTVSAPQAAQLAPLMSDIRASHLLTQALQLRGDANGFHLDIKLDAHPEAKQSDILQKMTETAGHKLDSPLAPASSIAHKRDDGGSSGLQAAESDPAHELGFSPGPSDNVWTARESLFAQKDTFVVKIGLLPTAISKISQDVVRLGGTVVAQSVGVLYAAFSNTAGDYAPLGNLYACIDFGPMTILQTPPTLRDDAPLLWGPGKPDPLMQAVKQQFDPNGTLNPGATSEESNRTNLTRPTLKTPPKIEGRT